MRNVLYQEVTIHACAIEDAEECERKLPQDLPRAPACHNTTIHPLAHLH